MDVSIRAVAAGRARVSTYLARADVVIESVFLCCVS